MADEQQSGDTKQKTNGTLMIIMGCMLLVVAISNSGPLQWLMYALAIGMFCYAAVIAMKKEKKKNDEA
jgi:hypothetical protein